MLDIVGNTDSERGGLFLLKCKKCGEETTNNWVGDPFALRFNATCGKCGEFGEFRLNIPKWIQLPIKPWASHWPISLFLCLFDN